jgi:hypothetical protein
MIDPQPLGLRERAGLCKAALDAGFDVLADGPNSVFGSGSHAPVSCAVHAPPPLATRRPWPDGAESPASWCLNRYRRGPGHRSARCRA